MKKLLAILLVLAMVFSLAACGGEAAAPETKGSEAANNGNAPVDTPNAGGDTVPSGSEGPYEVELLMPTMMNIPSNEAIQAVEDAINNHLANDLGITDFKLDLKFQSLMDYETTIGLELASGGKHDIIYAGALNTAVTNGYVLELTDMLENELADTMAVMPENWILSGMINGKVYAIPRYNGLVGTYKYIFDTGVYGDVVDWSTVDSLDDLDAVMPKLKAAAPDEFPFVYNNELVRVKYIDDHVSVVGTYLATVGDSPELVNIFATDAFREGVEMAYRWSQAGYSNPEGSANTLGHDAIINSGASKGVMMAHSYTVETIDEMFTQNNSYGATFKSVQIAVNDLPTNTITYGIAYTSENPSAAAKMLNLIWTDAFVMNSLIYGLEGTSWVWNEDHSSIVYPEGLSLETVPYTALYSCGAFGNQFLLHPMNGQTTEADKVYMAELNNTAWVPPLIGFQPSSENVATQIAAVNNIYNQYYKVLTYGDVDPEVYLPEFLAALETAGINDIIADYQKQADEWLAALNKS